MLERVPLDELQPGMYVNQVLEQKGALKMRSKGLVKTQNIIDTLKAKGIFTLTSTCGLAPVTKETISMII